MPLPTPNLDDRRFQDLVDDAKRLVQQRCPEWTDHNVSDPGVTLIETFAQMVDQLIYRLNRVPDRHYIKFLDLLGVQLFPPTAATGTVTFWLAAPQSATVVVRAETEVATPRTDIEEPVVFGTTEELQIVPSELHRVATQAAGQEPSDETPRLDNGQLPCFSAVPRPGDALLVGLSSAVPSCAVVLRFDCPVRGHGIDPRHPPLVWEAWNGEGWSACELERDEAGGFNRSGDVVLHVPASHRVSVIARQRAGWLRCRVVPAAADQPEYVATPEIAAIRAFTIGGSVGIVHAETIHDEALGVSDGTPGQRFALQRRPVLPAGRPAVLQVSDEAAGWTDWLPVGDFAMSAEADRHYRLDSVAGEVEFGPAVRLPGGGLRQYGAVPSRGSTLRMSAYRVGGGAGGNIARGQIRVLKTSVPYVARVENRAPAIGGVEGETVENAKLRGPLELRASGRAVTADDFEELARTAAPDAARVRCVAADERGAPAVRLLVVPKLTADSLGALPEDELRRPSTDLLQRIAGHLDARRLVGTRLLVAPPEYHGVTVVASLRARAGGEIADARRAAVRALYSYLSPLTGGPDGTGWPFGRAVQIFEVSAILAAVPGIATIDEVRLFPADLATGRRGDSTQRIDIGRDSLVLSYQHQVRVT
jgi:predicted phage baseplate assembly protein